VNKTIPSCFSLPDTACATKSSTTRLTG
jgi:hypothetical protein